jgi:hypothetical protein
MRKQWILTPLAVLVAVLLLQSLPAAQNQRASRTPVDVSKLGPQVGDLVPDFRLDDQNGRTWTRQGIMGSRGAMLVFFRSADW